MGLDARNQVFRVCEQHRGRPICQSIQSDQGLCYLLVGKYNIGPPPPPPPPRILEIWGEWLFIFRELGSTGNNFRGAREQAHNFWDIGSLAKRQLEDLKVLRRSPDLLNNVKIGQGHYSL